MVCAIGVMSCVSDSDGADEPAHLVAVGDDVPDFTLSTPGGGEVSAASLHGQVFILNFFDTRCADCQEELLVLQRIYETYRDELQILNVPRSQTQAEVQAYWTEQGLTMPFHIPHDRNLYYRFANQTIPRTYVIDGNGKVCAAFSDAPTADFLTLDTLLRQLLGDPAGREGNVNLTMRLKVSASGDIDEYHFHNEYTISRLDVYFFNAETKQFFTKVSATNLTKAESPYGDQYDITYLFENVRLRAGLYDIFTIANYDYAPDEPVNEADFLDMVDDLTYREGIEASMPDKGPVMTNTATSLLGIDLIPWIDKNYTMNVEIERVMAKLQIGVSQNTFQLNSGGRVYANVNLTNYKLVNLNTQYYLFQHKDSMEVMRGAPVFQLPFNYSDYSDQGDQYVVDPLFYQKTPNTANANMFRNYYKSWFGSFTTEDFASMPAADSYGYAYVLENTAFKTCQKNGYSPGIVFKGAVSPTFVYLYDFSQQMLKEEYRPEYWPETIYLYNYNFYGSIQAINIASGLALDELEKYTDAQLKTYGIKQCKFNMGVYETYYAYWIQHRGSTDNPMGPMQYGIVRNNFYKIVVTGINGIGNSTVVPDVMRDNYPNSYVDVKVDANN